MLTIEWVAKRRIMERAELRVVNIEEFVGALADFTGEIGGTSLPPVPPARPCLWTSTALT